MSRMPGLCYPMKETGMRSGTRAEVGSAKKISRRQKLSVLAAAVAGVLAFRTAQAVDYTWDAVGTPGVAPAGGAGIWNTAGFNWTSDAGATYIAWPNTDPNTDNAIFGGTAGTVSLGAAINSGSVTFTTTGYLIDNGGGSAPTPTTWSVTGSHAAAAGINARRRPPRRPGPHRRRRTPG